MPQMPSNIHLMLEGDSEKLRIANRENSIQIIAIQDRQMFNKNAEHGQQQHRLSEENEEQQQQQRLRTAAEVNEVHRPLSRSMVLDTK